MSSLHSFELAAADSKLIRGDRSIGRDHQILFITGFLSKRWGNKSKALVQWCEEKGWGFCCYDARGFGESEGAFTDYTLSDWIADARLVLNMLRDGRHLTLPPRACRPRLLSRGTRLFPESPLSATHSVAGSRGSWRKSFRKLSG
jgi:hypothetical protein